VYVLFFFLINQIEQKHVNEDILGVFNNEKKQASIAVD